METQAILDALAKEGVEIPEEVKTKVTGKFKAYALTDAGSVIKEGQIAVNEDSHKEKMEDLKKYKAEARKFQGLYEETKDALDGDESHNAKLLEKYKSQNEHLKGIADRYVEDAKSRWDGVKENIPERLQDKFVIPEAEDGELTEEQLFGNLDKYKEYKEVNPEAFGEKVEEGEKPPFSAPKGRKDGRKQKGGGDEQWRDKPVSERIAMGYKHSPDDGSGDV